MAVTTDPNDPGIRKILPSGQQASYRVLTDEELAKGYARPVRHYYVHVACGAFTRMPLKCAETYAANPAFYSGTFCCNCGKHFPLKENGVPQFTWEDGTAVGS